MSPEYVLALDQGTTSSRAIVFDRDGSAMAVAQREYPQGYPFPGHVTHDAEDIWASQIGVAQEVLTAIPGGAGSIAAVGITNQRETTIVWDRLTGVPIAPAIVWQSRVTADRCRALRAAGHEARVRALTGLPVDAYFSGPKIAHILDAESADRAPGPRRASCASGPWTASWSGASVAAEPTSPMSPMPAARCSSTSVSGAGIRGCAS